MSNNFKSCYMMATKAKHQLGNLSRDEPDLCYVKEENESNYIGSWVTGFGFFGVEFPKNTTRALTDAEIKKYNKTRIQIASHEPQLLRVD